MSSLGLSAPRPLSADDDPQEFDSGIAALDDWLKRRARANEAAGASRTFVLCSEKRIVGYYSLAAGAVMHAVATSKVRRNMPDPVPAILLGRLAVDRSWHGKGLGGDLLMDAVSRAMGAAETIGVRVILVHAISQDAKSFYERFGFRPSPLEPLTLMMTIEEVRRLIERRA